MTTSRSLGSFGIVICLALVGCMDVEAPAYDDARGGDGCGAEKCDDWRLSDAGASSDAEVGEVGEDHEDDRGIVARGISLHVGLNDLDWTLPVTTPVLSGAENDAVAMEKVAAGAGFETQALLGREATSDEFFAIIEGAAEELVAGDTFLLTFSGHGTRERDESGDERDGQDELLAFYDRAVVDDELRGALAAFVPGVFVVVVVDACHSGTIVDCPEGPTPHAPIDATVLSLSASRDSEIALDGRFGQYTSVLLDAGGLSTWPGDTAEFNYLDDYRQLHRDTRESLVYNVFGRTSVQHPAIHVCGPDSEKLITKVAFDLQPWMPEEVLIGSAHPYENDVTEDYIVTAPPGTTAFRLNFRKIALRGRTDAVEVYDGEDNLIASYNFRDWDRLTPAIVGDHARVRLVTDSSGTWWGFEIDRIDYR